jgi:hypothetical protein
MMDADRLGPRAQAWSEAPRGEIFAHILRLEMALRTALPMLENSIYRKSIPNMLADWRQLLEAVPTDKPAAEPAG